MLSNDMSRTRTVDKPQSSLDFNGDTVVMNKEDFAAAARLALFRDRFDHVTAHGIFLTNFAVNLGCQQASMPVMRKSRPPLPSSRQASEICTLFFLP